MKQKTTTRKLLALLLSIAIVLCILPTTVSAVDPPPAPTNVRWDGYILRWDAVPGATEYALGKRKDGRVFEGISTTINTYYDFSEMFAENGKGAYSINIYARIGGVNSDPASAPKLSYPPAPTNVRWDGYILRWDAVLGATEYALGKRKDGRIFEGNSTTINTYYDFSEMFAEFNGGVYSINIYARIGDVNSDPASAPDIEVAHTHKWKTTYTSDENGHWYACKGCSEKKDFAEHNITEHLHDEIQHWGKCSICGGFGAKTDHTGGEWQSDEANHWKDCTVAGCGTITATKAAHTFSSDCDRFCDICHYERADTAPHDYRMSTDSAEHWLECPDCHEEKAESREAHKGGYATTAAKAICEVCHTEYGELATAVVSGNCGDPDVNSGKNVRWTLDSAGTLTISGTGNIASYSSGNYNPAPWREHETSIKRIVIESGVTGIGKYAFAFLSSMTDITLPDTLISIGEYSFNNCSVMESITIPDSVTTIDAYAFSYCKKLRDITLSAGVTSISKGLFKNCSSLASFTIPNTVTAVLDEAFYGCSSLAEIVSPESISEISGSMFERCTSLSSVTIPNTVTKIGSSAFGYCTSLRKIQLPDSVTEMGRNVFLNCTNLKFANIPSQLTTVPSGMFYGCSKLIDVPIPTGVTVIESYAFSDCKSLTSVIIPEGVTEIKSFAFGTCTGLKTIVLPTTLTKIDSTSFMDIKTSTWIYYNGTQEQFDAMLAPATLEAQNFVTAYTYSQKAGRKVPPTSGNLGTMGKETDVKWVLDGDTLTITGRGWTDSWVTAPWHALKNSIKKIVVGEGVTNIRGGFDSYYHLTEISLPDSLAFCPDGLVQNCCELTDITLPDGITKVGISAFDGCDMLKSVTLPKTITAISNNAFRGCDNLTDIYFDGTKAQWDAITVGTNNEPLVNATVHCIAGECGDPADNEGKNVAWAISDDTLAISGTGKMADFDSLHPTPWNAKKDRIKHITVDGSVTNFVPSAFADYTALVDITVDLGEGKEVVISKTAAASMNDTLSLTLELITDPTPEQQTKLPSEMDKEKALIVDVTALIGGANVHALGGNVTVTVPYNTADLQEGEIPAVYYLPTSGEAEKIEAVTVGDGFVSFTVDHFSEFAIGPLSSNHVAGDINGDGRVNVNDLVRLAQKQAGWDVEVAEASLDVNGDGKFNVSDLVRLAQYLAGWDVEIF